jgi:rRNA pseudouridine-1189 N-methylase Emg1 (Nep1/Mra1 family)
MDLATRKNKFIEQFEKIKDANLVERFETFLKNELNQKEIVAFSINGTPISKKEYIKRNEKAVKSFKNGKFKTQKEILEKYKKGI